MPARYLVTMPPGAQVPGVGFVKVAEEFTAPEEYVPSLTHRPLNEEAQAILDRLYETEKAKRAEALERVTKKGKPEAIEEHQKRVNDLEVQRLKVLPIVVLPREEPKKGPGVTMDELARLNAAGVEPKVDERKPAPKGPRAADR